MVHPPYSDMVVATIRSLASPTGVSRQAIIKKMKEDYQLGDNATHISNWVNITLKKGLQSGLLKKAAAEGRKGAGSYKLGDRKPSGGSLSKSSAKSVTGGSPRNIKKPKIKKITTPASRLKSKTIAKNAKSKVVKKIETSKAGKTKPKKIADAAVKTKSDGAKKPTTASKKPSTAVKKPITAKKLTTAAKKPATAAKKPATAAKKPTKSAAAVKKTASPKKKAGSAVGGKKSGKP